MKAILKTGLQGSVAAAVMVLASAGMPALAQPAPTPGTQISGAQLQAWLDGKFSYSGVNKASQCVVLNVAQGSGRLLFVGCPNGWADKLVGTARVEGDRYCTSFPIPNTPSGEDCVTWHAIGPWTFEQRKGNDLDTTVIVLPQGLTSPK